MARYRAEQAAAQTKAVAAAATYVDCPDPVVFAQDWLGVTAWPRQAEILRAVAEHPRVAVRSGHKTGKTLSAAALALWWVTRKSELKSPATVVMTSTTDRQVRIVLWRELTALRRQAKRPLGGELSIGPDPGLRFQDGRLIVGFVPGDSDAMGGFSGDNLLFIIDEASGVKRGIFEAIEGNRAGGARLVMFGNPIRLSGEFYDAFHSKRHLYKTLHVSSEEAADYQASGHPVPGLATQTWVEEKRQEWAPPETHPLFSVRVAGDFPSQAENAVIPLSFVEAAHDRWEEREAKINAPVPPPPLGGKQPMFGANALLPLPPPPAAPDLLEIGVDCARFGDDDSAICPRRGKLAFPIVVRHGMDGVDLARAVLEVVRLLRESNEAAKPRVKVDVVGLGASCFDVLRRFHASEVETIPVNVGESPTTDGYQRLRDQLWFEAAEWLKDGGILPPDSVLDGELVAPIYTFGLSGKRVVEAKDDTKAKIKRSPDRADALCLAVYNAPPKARTSASDSPMGHWG